MADEAEVEGSRRGKDGNHEGGCSVFRVGGRKKKNGFGLVVWRGDGGLLGHVLAVAGRRAGAPWTGMCYGR